MRLISAIDWNVAGPAIGAVVGAILLHLVNAYTKVKTVNREVDSSETREQHDLAAKRRAEDRKVRKDMLDEQQEMINALKADRDTDRNTIHELRGEANRVNVRLAVCETQLKSCEDDRIELHRQIGLLVRACEQKGIHVNLTKPAPGGEG
jgi:septal ring factor EnvC (AmiA/AmiB activator)